MAQIELKQKSRTAVLRDMYWDKTHDQAVFSKKIAGSGDETLTGHAHDFEALLDAGDPVIQSDELIVGCCLATPEPKESLNLGFYNNRKAADIVGNLLCFVGAERHTTIRYRDLVIFQ